MTMGISIRVKANNCVQQNKQEYHLTQNMEIDMKDLLNTFQKGVKEGLKEYFAILFAPLNALERIAKNAHKQK